MIYNNNDSTEAFDIVAKARIKQLEKGFDLKRDVAYQEETLARAAIAYTLPSAEKDQALAYFYPLAWDPASYSGILPDTKFTLDERIEELGKAGALIIAQLQVYLFMKNQQEIMSKMCLVGYEVTFHHNGFHMKGRVTLHNQLMDSIEIMELQPYPDSTTILDSYKALDKSLEDLIQVIPNKELDEKFGYKSLCYENQSRNSDNVNDPNNEAEQVNNTIATFKHFK